MPPLSQRTFSPTWVLDHQKQAAKTNEKEVPSYSQSIQAVCHKYLFARQSAHHAIQQGHAARYPYKKKKDFPTKWAKDGFKVYEKN
ncbi:hypothetical protein PcaKH35_21510 [Parageobacillus caldoxylosilyticus]|jgi:putative transposase|nr:hypothetical protein PcaKH35_21510 [Parageobacillus caldoxylosilyticus]